MTPKESCEKEITRFFNKYYNFCESSEPDDLKDLLAALCSSIEKLEKTTKQKFKNNKRFVALKALKNFSTHESELLNESKALGLHSQTEVHAEVQILCLIQMSAIEYVLNNLRSDFTKKCIKEKFIFYKRFVDIYPALFNASVDLYFLAEKHSLTINGEGFSSITRSIQYEKEHGYPHIIDGKIIMLNGSDLNKFLDDAVISIEEKNFEQSSLTINESRLYVVTSLYSTSPIEQVDLMKKEDKKHILDQLLVTKGIEIETDDSDRHVAYITRDLTPIEVVIAHQYAESLNNRT